MSGDAAMKNDRNAEDHDALRTGRSRSRASSTRRAQLVFDAYTKPELLKRWLFGMRRLVAAVCEIDLRVGGKYRYVWSTWGTARRWAWAARSARSWCRSGS